MTTRFVPTAQHKKRAADHIRQLAKDVKQSFPDMDVDQHLTDAAREADAGRHDNAKRHLDAAISAFAPLQLIRHGIHDDTGHMAAKNFMQRAHRGRLLVQDAEHISGANQQLLDRRKDEKMSTDQGARAAQLSWAGVDGAIELATFAGAKPGSGRNFAKLSASLASRGAKNPGALAAYIGRKKYGRKGFAKLGHSHAAPTAGGIELVGPKGYIHGWIHASMATLSKSGGGAYLPEHPGFGAGIPNTLSRSEHRKAAAGHLHMMKQAPAGSDKARLHHKFARLHAAASMAAKSGATYARAPRTGLFASETTGIELVGPKGYVHGWRYVGGPGLPANNPWSYARHRASRQHISAAKKAGRAMHQHMETARTTAGGGQFSHLPPDIAKALNDYDANVKSGVIGFSGGSKFATSYPGRDATEAALGRFIGSKVSQFGWDDPGGVIGLSADTGRLASQPHPLGKPGGPGLWGVKGMELPPYIQNIARALLRKGRARNLSQAIAMAKGATGRWEHGKNTSPEVRAASAATNAQWAAKQARAHAHANGQPGIELAFHFNPMEKRDSSGKWTAGDIADKLHNSYKYEMNPTTSDLARKAEVSLRANDLGAARRHLLDLAEYHQGNLAAIDKRGYRRHYGESKHRTHQVYGGLASQAREMAESIGEGHPDEEKITRMQDDLGMPPAPLPSDAELEAQMGLNDTKTLAEMSDDELAAELAKRKKAKVLSFTGTAAGAAQDPRNVLGQFGSGGQGKGAAGKTRAQRKAALLAAAKNDRIKARLLAIRIAADRAALASAGGKVTRGQKGAVTTARRSTTGSTAPAAKGAARTPAPAARQASPISAAQASQARTAATTAARKMSKTQLASAIKAMTAQEKQLLAAATAAAAQAAKL
jgi:hypothetical protein